MGKATAASSALLAALLAACTALAPAPGHPPSTASRPPVAGAATPQPAASTPPATVPVTAPPVRHRREKKRHAAPAPVPYGVTCQPAALRLAQGPRTSEATQQETLVLTLTNISAAGCDLDGYPGISLLTVAGRPLPFDIRWGGDQMLITAAPVLVPLAPGATAYLGINKNACVRHSYRAAHIFQVIPPGDYQALSFTKPHYPILDYCRAPDPGHAVDVTPVEPTLRGIIDQRPFGG